MSFRAFIVCEDHTLDQYTCVPIVEAMLAKLGKTRANVRAVTSPHLTGISHVEEQFAAIAARYAAICDLLVFMLDRDALDGEAGRGDRRTVFDNKLAELPESVREKVRVTLAVEETEVWCLWGSRGDVDGSWQAVRAERDSKEMYFDKLLQPGDARLPGRGRQRLIRRSLESGWESLATGCPELRELEQSVRVLVE